MNSEHGYDFNGAAHTAATRKMQEQTQRGQPQIQLTLDDKGRRAVDEMSDRELMEEQVRTLRQVSDTVTSFMDSLATNPMFAMMAKGMMGRKKG